MCHYSLAAMAGEHFQDDTDIRIIVFYPENCGAAHPVQRLEDHVLVLSMKSPQTFRVCAHQHRRAALGKMGGENLLIAVPQALAPIHHECALAFRLLQDIGAVDVLVIKRRILAHQDHVKISQGALLALAQRKPALRVVKDGERGHAGPGDTLLEVQVALLHVVQLPVLRFGRP